MTADLNADLDQTLDDSGLAPGSALIATMFVRLPGTHQDRRSRGQAAACGRLPLRCHAVDNRPPTTAVNGGSDLAARRHRWRRRISRKNGSVGERERYGMMMKSDRVGPPNPRRVAADNLNAMQRVGFSEDGLARLRAAAPFTPPRRYSTGPRTAEGKARSSANGRTRQVGPMSVRELRRELAVVNELCAGIARTRVALIAER